MPNSWTESLWADVAPIYDAILGHPFLRGLTSGDLLSDRFAYYIAQDADYLRDYARALAVIAAKAPTHTDAGMLARHAAGTVDVELTLHAVLMPQLGLANEDLDRIPMSPTTLGYTSYLLASAYGGSFAEGLATVLPCYWIYARVAEALVDRGSPDPGRAPGSVLMLARSSPRLSPRRSHSPTESAQGWAATTKPTHATTSPSPPATSGCSGTPPGT